MEEEAHHRGHTPQLPSRREAMWFLAAVVVAVAVGLGISISIFGLPTLPAGPGDDGGRPEARPRQTVTIGLSEFAIQGVPTSVPRDSIVQFVVRNEGTVQHDFKVNGEEGAPRLEPGEGFSFEVGAAAGPITAWCTVLGHREQGMEITINVEP